jgi:hypothetical protein
VSQLEPGVRRLCAAVVGGGADLLARSCQTAAMGRVYVSDEHGPAIAVAPPGIDEAAMVDGLLAALHQSACTDPAALEHTVVAAFHVGIVRVDGNGFGGAGVHRVLHLAQRGALNAVGSADEAAPGPWMLTLVSEYLFTDLLAEGWPAEGWHPVPAAGAWYKRYPMPRPATSAAQRL